MLYDERECKLILDALEALHSLRKLRDLRKLRKLRKAQQAAKRRGRGRHAGPTCKYTEYWSWEKFINDERMTPLGGILVYR